MLKAHHRRDDRMSSLAPPLLGLLSTSQRWLVLAVLAGVAGLVMFARLGPLDEILKARGEGGILALEFAWSSQRASEILEAWHGLEEVVRRQTWWDYVFLLCYPLMFSLACAMLSDARANPVPMIGAFVAWAVLLAIPLDAIENLSMLIMLENGASGFLAQLASWCAGIKFAVLLAAVGYLLLAGSSTLVQRLV